MAILCTAADILMDEKSRLSDAAHVCSDENIRRVWDQRIKYMFFLSLSVYVCKAVYVYRQGVTVYGKARGGRAL